MPEGPEAHIMADRLNNILRGKSVLSITILDSKHSKGLENFDFPSKVVEVKAYGKRPIIMLEGSYIITFLCMNGRWLLKEDKCTRVILSIGTFTFEDFMFVTDHEFNLYFDDSREQGIGKVEWSRNWYSLMEYQFTIGYDLILYTPTYEDFKYSLINSFKPEKFIEDALLSQKSNSTIGNYLKSEVLYESRVNPYRQLKSITDEEMYKIYYFSIKISRDSYSNEGFTTKDFLKPDGSHGGFKCKVYNREGEFDDHGYKIIRTKNKDRSTFWVRELQI